jgi:prepilin-type N-terminal cleavage/methylation domain-containing protein
MDMEYSMMFRSEEGKRSRADQGFSLIEVMIAIVILMIGLLGLLSLFTTALSATAHAEQDLVAKQKARELLEAVYSARDDSGIGWAQIQNDTVTGGAFKTGWQPLVRVTPNTNQILGTSVPGEGTTPDYMLAPDPAGNLTVQVPLTNFERRVDILPVIQPDGTPNLNLRLISVTVRQLTNPPRDYTVAGYISSYR